MDKKTGLVAFFDILGYQNFLEKNEPEVAAEKISELLKKLKAFQSEKYLTVLGKDLESTVKPIVGKIAYLVISDAILLTLEADKSNIKDYMGFHFFFLAYCSRLFKELFMDCP
jgi:hypothetical protein